MTEPNFDKAIPAAETTRRRGISAVWLLPLFAVILGGWLAYKHFNEAGVSIVVTFTTGEGVQAGTTEVRYKGIKVGNVNELHVQPDLQSVAAHITLTREAEAALKEDTQFWLVKPELSLAGVQGLDTLVSGNYIALRPGTSSRTKHVFKALNEPPPPEPAQGDLEIQLIAPDVGSLHAGSPIHYRKLRVGEIVDYQLSADRNRVVFKAHINAEYADLVNQQSRFWNSSGVAISGDLNSIEINTDSLASIILGGLSFDTPPGTAPGELAQSDDVFTIYSNYSEANTGIEIDIEFETAEGLKANHTEIRYKGLTAGKIIKLDMKPDYSAVTATASINPLAPILLNESTEFWLATPKISLSQISGLSTLLTGSHIEMDFAGNTPSGKRAFTALKEPPAPKKNEEGLYLTLMADKLDGLTRDSAIHYRDITIGKVVDFHLNENREQVNIDILIFPKYQDLITHHAHFYQNSGVEFSASLEGVQVNTGSLSSILSGGINVYLANIDNDAEMVAPDTRFTLLPSIDDAIDRGPMINIHFANGSGLKTGAAIKYLGVEIGKIEDIQLNHPAQGVTALASIAPEARELIVKDSTFWRVKPSISLDKIANLGTLIFGEYIAFEPGEESDLGYEFNGRDKPPEDYLSDSGLTLTLQAPSLASIKKGRSVFYREIPIGQVTGFELDPSAQHINIYVYIEPYYAPLIKSNTVFWNATGIAFDFGWLKGASLRTGSAQSLLAGGIALATPDLPGDTVTDGSVFKLHDVPEEGWKDWQPEIPLKIEEPQ
ncbi:MlaD family protein [Gilvimarinus sp. SDUM040013]|uniref:MlaD family protein n=1 Tax=Gilvimarinus gilvus TaxID=3058038 RepID=A0ABU4S328_9GAMM|nr:MlaD family protein [Gilvimarinus sp. SDUM040013]MDO3384971.1 MlaD family protein [Gilvimarinus sp. SDUM040013]MDX6851497.1 MlaD family protein [Gilvimarinus sp. SDUM040013]